MSPSPVVPLSTWLRRIALGILVAGAVLGGFVYLTADPHPLGAGTVQIINGEAYSVDPADDRQRQYQDERMGGQAAVLIDELEVWFAERWRGRALGITLAVLGAVIAAVLAWSAQFFDPLEEADDVDGADEPHRPSLQ